MNHHALSYGPDDQLTADDLRAYRAGQLRGAALHRVERLLLENPFYADALDGLDALQQAGANLHTHTRDLHLALQERVGETATPRRLMPMWITSAAASIVLVICVAVYYFFYVLPVSTHVPAKAADGIAPGTVLIESKTLGIGEPTGALAPVAKATSVGAHNAEAPKPKSEHRRQEQRTSPTVAPPNMAITEPVRLASTAEPVVEDRDIMPLPISQADMQRRQTVNTERAFMQR